MKVWYMNGAGNDFMVLDARGQKMDFASMAQELCKLTGADGFMAVDHSEIGDFKLHFYNSDGSRGEMCGNGSRCICRFAYDSGIAGESMAVETDAGMVYGQRLAENRYRVQMNLPSVLDFQRKAQAAYVELGNPGLPHAVQEYSGDLWADADSLRPVMQQLRFDPAFPKGANVNFYTLIDLDTVRILTFERGVEDFTLACGTGSCATAYTLWAQGKLPTGKLTVLNRGGALTVTIQGKEQVEAIFLEGLAETEKIYEL